jgi:hypothetical protein
MRHKLILLGFLLFSLSCCQTQHGAVEQPADISNVVYKGGDGKSPESAVLILGAGNEQSGIAAEYAYISKLNGERNKDWRYGEQSTVMHEGKRIDVIMIHTIPSNSTITYYFDITDFYGK